MPSADYRAPTDMKSLANALNQAPEGIGEIRRILCSATFCPRLPGLTKMISKLSKEGAFRKGLEVFHALPDLGIAYDTTITNAAISACDKGSQWQAALEIFWSMPDLNLRPDAITYSSVISALAKGKQWAAALQVFEDMQEHKVAADVVACCSLISALERGGQWQLAEQLFKQMCSASCGGAGNQPLSHLAAALETQPSLTDASSSSSLSSDDMQQLFNGEVGFCEQTSSRSTAGSQVSVTESPQKVSCPTAAAAKAWTGGYLAGLDLGPRELLPCVSGEEQPVCRTASSLSQLYSMSSVGSKSFSEPNSFESAPEAVICTPVSQKNARLSVDPARLVTPCFAGSKSFEAAIGSQEAGTPQSGSDSQKSTQLHAEARSITSGSTQGPFTSGIGPAWQASESYKLPPVTPHQEAKPGLPKKHVALLSSILESSSEATFSPVAPPAPIKAGSGHPSEVSDGFVLDESGRSAPTKQYSAGGLTLAARHTARPPRSALHQGAAESTQLTIDGCPLPVCLERQPGNGGAPGPLVPRLKHMNVSGVAPNRVCCNALLAAFARARPAQWHKALTLLDAMTVMSGELSPDVVSYNTCLKACGSAGKLDHAIQVYRNMVQERVAASITTFGTLLTAASHSGSIHTVKQIWQWLTESGLEVSSACVHAYVSALAKRGHWDEASQVLHYHTERQGGQLDPALRQAAGLLPPVHAHGRLLPMPNNAAHGQPPMYGPSEPEKKLHKLSQAATSAAAQDLPMLASEALAAFQQCSAAGFVPGHAFAGLLCVLGCGGLWDTALDVYRTVSVREVLEPGMVSNLIASYAASGQFFWALHYWLAQSQRRGGPAPTLQAHQALLCACHARGTWQPALHILQAMLASHVQPDRLCFGAVLQLLVRAGLLPLAAQVLLLMPKSQVWPDAVLLSDVLSCLDPAAISTAPGLDALLQVMAGGGLSDAAGLATVIKHLNPAILPHIALHLLNCLPPGAEKSGDTHWLFAGSLLYNHQLPAAIQVTYRGHAVGALKHYRPLVCASSAQSAGEKRQAALSDPLVKVDLSSCAGAECAALVLLAWVCSFSQALLQDTKITASEVVLSVGQDNPDRAQQRAGVIAAVKSILGSDPASAHNSLLQAVRTSLCPQLRAIAANMPRNGEIVFPTAAVTAWITSMHDLAKTLLAPL